MESCLLDDVERIVSILSEDSGDEYSIELRTDTGIVVEACVSEGDNVLHTVRGAFNLKAPGSCERPSCGYRSAPGMAACVESCNV